MADLNKLSEGTVEDAKAELGNLSGDELMQLRTLEEDGKNRSTFLDALDDEEARRAEGNDGDDTADSSDTEAKDGDPEAALRARNKTMEP